MRVDREHRFLAKFILILNLLVYKMYYRYPCIYFLKNERASMLECWDANRRKEQKRTSGCYFWWSGIRGLH